MIKKARVFSATAYSYFFPWLLVYKKKKKNRKIQVTETEISVKETKSHRQHYIRLDHQPKKWMSKAKKNRIF
jgi:hypothetical protein